MMSKSKSMLVVTAVLACAGAATASSFSTTPQNAPSPSALTGLQSVQGDSVSIPANSYGSAYAYCPAGKTVIGTGFYNSISTPAFVLAYGTFVGGFFFNNTSIANSVYVQALCASDATGLSALTRTTDFERDVRLATEQFNKLNGR